MSQGITRRQALKGMAGLAGSGALLTLLPAVASCRPTEPTAPSPTTAPVQATATTAPAPEPSPTAAAAEGCSVDFEVGVAPPIKKYSGPVQVTYPFNTSGGVKFKLPEENETNNPMYRFFRDELGIEYVPKWVAASGDVAAQKMAAAMAAGDLPEMFTTSGEQYEILVENDTLADIKDIFERVATPLVKEKLQYPDGKQWIPLMRKGGLLGTAVAMIEANVEMVGYIRQDLLDKLNMPVPKTLEELDETVRKMHETKEIKYGVFCDKSGLHYLLSPVFGAFGVMPRVWLKSPDGKLEYGSINPGIKDALAWLRKWYADGLMDPEFYAKSRWDDLKMVADHGVHWGEWWWTRQAMTVEKEVPGVRWFMEMGAPKGPNGKYGRASAYSVGWNMVYLKGLAPEKIERALMHLNWEIENHANGLKYNSYGAMNWDELFLEGYDWEFTEDCEIRYADYNTGLMVRRVGYHYDNNAYPDFQLDRNKNVATWYAMDRSTLNKAQRMIASDFDARRRAAYQYLMDHKDEQIKDEWWGVPTERMVRLLPDLRVMEEQAFVGIVTGQRSLDAFDAFVKEWKQAGVIRSPRM